MDEIAIVWRSPPIAHGPFAVLSNLPEADKEKTASYLSALYARNPVAYDVLNPFHAGGYAAVDPRDYSGLSALTAMNVDAIRLPGAPRQRTRAGIERPLDRGDAARRVGGADLYLVRQPRDEEHAAVERDLAQALDDQVADRGPVILLRLRHDELRNPNAGRAQRRGHRRVYVGGLCIGGLCVSPAARSRTSGDKVRRLQATLAVPVLSMSIAVMRIDIRLSQ